MSPDANGRFRGISVPALPYQMTVDECIEIASKPCLLGRCEDRSTCDEVGQCYAMTLERARQ